MKAAVEAASVPTHRDYADWPPHVHEQTKPGIAPPPSQTPPPTTIAVPTISELQTVATFTKTVIAMTVSFVTAIGAGAIWVNTRASKADLDEKIAAVVKAQQAIDDERGKQLKDLSERTVRLETKLDDFRQTEDTRWNTLDHYLGLSHVEQTTQTSPPAFGPAARTAGRHGP